VRTGDAPREANVVVGVEYRVGAQIWKAVAGRTFEFLGLKPRRCPADNSPYVILGSQRVPVEDRF
jgi:hypothetical protein